MMIRNTAKIIGLFLLAVCILTRAFAQPVATGHDHATHQSADEISQPAPNSHAAHHGQETKKDAPSHSGQMDCCKHGGHDDTTHKKTDNSKDSRCQVQCDMTSAPALPSSDVRQTNTSPTTHCPQSPPQLKGTTCPPEQRPPIR